MLRLYQPCLPTRVYAAPQDPRWVFDLKLDGFRIVARKTPARVVLQTKEGYDYTDRYPLIVDALRRMRARSVVFDGEAMCGNSFDDLWNRAADEHFRLCAFDILELNGEDLRDQPLQERKRRLAQLLRRDRDGLEHMPHLQGEGQLILRKFANLAWKRCLQAALMCRTGPTAKHWLKR